MSGLPDRASAIGERLAAVLGAPLAAEPRQLSGGASQETWVFELEPDGCPLVLQLLRPERAGPEDLRPRLLRAAAEAGGAGTTIRMISAMPSAVPMARERANQSAGRVTWRIWACANKVMYDSGGSPKAAGGVTSVELG